MADRTLDEELESWMHAVQSFLNGPTAETEPQDAQPESDGTRWDNR
jgi:hypothetical protein